VASAARTDLWSSGPRACATPSLLAGPLLMAAPLAERPFSKTQLFCSNLPWSVNGKMLRQAFEKHGEVIDAFVAYNGRSSRGFGYVTFKEPSGAATAVTPLHLLLQNF